MLSPEELEIAKANITPEQCLWIIHDDAVQKIMWWTEGPYSMVTVTPPTGFVPKIFALGVDAFRSEWAALKANRERIDCFRRYWDKAAEINQKHIAVYEQAVDQGTLRWVTKAWQPPAKD